MNIDLIQRTDTQNTESNVKNEAVLAENEKITAQSAKALTFKLEVPNKKSFIDYLNLGTEDLTDLDQSDTPSESISLGSVDKIDAKLFKNLQNFASNKKLPVRVKDINDVRLLIYSQDIFKNDKESSLKISKIDQNDIEFLKKCSENPEININSVNPQSAVVNYVINNNIEKTAESGLVSYKSLNVSKTLVNIIEYAHKTQKPVRLDFEGDSSVILKIDNEGKLTAQFISSDKAMENLLKNSLPQLRNKMDSEGLPYKEISYKEQNNKNGQSNQQEDNSYE
jgi:hypothetical protein